MRRDGRSVNDAHDRVRAAIVSGRFPPGSYTTQVAIGRELGISRTPLREAVRMLARDGLIELEPNQRVRITPLSIDDVEELYAMRIALETLAICKTVPLFSDADVAELESLCETASREAEGYASRGDGLFERAEAAHDVFHHRFISGAGPRLADAIAQLSDHADRYRLVNLMLSSFPDRDATRRAMVAATRTRDGAAVAAAFAGHCKRSAEKLIEELRREPPNAMLEPGALRVLEA